jgi:hypothetical protein
MPQNKPHFASQAFSFPHFPSQPVPRSQQKVAKLSGAVLLEEQGHYRLLDFVISTPQNPTGKRPKIFPIEDNAIPRNVVAPYSIVMTCAESVA